MSINMSYCRFQNTLQALRECDQVLSEIDDDLSRLSADEKRAALALFRLCRILGESSEQEAA